MTKTDEVLKALPQWRAIASVIQAREGSCTAAESFIPAMVEALEALSSRIQPADDAVVERVARAVSEEIDAIDAELENTSALAVPCRDEFRRVSSERVARAAIAASPQGEKGE